MRGLTRLACSSPVIQRSIPISSPKAMFYIRGKQGPLKKTQGNSSTYMYLVIHIVQHDTTKCKLVRKGTSKEQLELIRNNKVCNFRCTVQVDQSVCYGHTFTSEKRGKSRIRADIDEIFLLQVHKLDVNLSNFWLTFYIIK